MRKVEGWAGAGVLAALMVLQGVYAQPIGRSAADAEPPKTTVIFPLAEVRRGQMGVAYTVFEGVNPEPMQVEILGVLKAALGPGQDMILARLHGSKPEYTGVVAGMSGSPVYIGGRLAGALSYRIGQFSKEPIAGITPIEQMFEVRDRAEAPDAGSHVAAAGASMGEVRPMDTPLVFSGVGADALAAFGDRFRALGLDPVIGLGGAASEMKQPEPIVPGSAVSGVLVRGDMTVAVTCTVTYVDPSRLLACGHPFMQGGAVEFPMTKATVLATLPSPQNSFKIVNETETVGAFTEDRSSAILGRFGRAARMIPVSVEVSGAAAPHTFHYEVLDNKDLTPNALLVSIYQSLHGTNSEGAETSYRLTGTLAVKGQPPVRLLALLTPTDSNAAGINAALYVNESLSRVYGNGIDKAVLTGLELHVEAIDERRSAVLESATLSRADAAAGETVDVLTVVRPYHGAPRVVTLPVRLPETLAPGPVRIVVSDAATLDRLQAPPPATAQHGLDLPDTIAGLNRRHANDRLYGAVLAHEPQAAVEGAILPGFPLSMANVYEPLRAGERLKLNGESVLTTGEQAVGYALSGAQVLTLNVR